MCDCGESRENFKEIRGNKIVEKKKICFIAQFPPPIHGLSKAVDTLYNSELNSCVSLNGEFEFEKIDITNNKNFLKNLN